MDSSSAFGRRRGNSRANAEDQALHHIAKEAEARLAARRQARVEARDVRMHELERQQKQLEQNGDHVFDMHTVASIDRLHLGNGISGSSVTIACSMEEGRSFRDMRHEFKVVEERFRRVMIANAQLDNDCASQTYQIQLLKEKLEEVGELYAQIQREFKEKMRDSNALQRSFDKLHEELKLVQGQLEERDLLIAKQGLVTVPLENEDGTCVHRVLVTVDNAQMLGSAQGSLDIRLKKLSEDKQELLSEIQHMEQQLKSLKNLEKKRGSATNNCATIEDDYAAQKEGNKIIIDYKYKLQKIEQEVASLQISLTRMDMQVLRYKSTLEAAEKSEAELKIERRKLQKENREAMEHLEELETSNNHLLKRIDKLKNAKSTPLKEF